MSTDKYVVTATGHVSAPPAAVHALLTDPQRHPELDGSGTVVEVSQSSAPLRVGSEFDMRMRRGFPYETRNTVVELEPDRVVAWTTRPLTRPLRWLIGGRVWRWELAPEAGGTRVTATWDLRPEKNRALVRPMAGDPGADLATTIGRIDDLLADRA
ncbi:SRPBCC family protein [Nocardioides plantarum]|uniref:SRPBCC family protein n=1 Tax=Nocardioides plantarum TaxID=29299 RepID=A0ABV5KHH6_9ACTN|nr:SRPBCC family protein [Nocardioides plantarum]